MIEDATINYVKGDTYTRDVTISDYDAEINKVLFTIKNNESDKRALLQKSLEIIPDNLLNKNNLIANCGINNNSTIGYEYLGGIAYIECKPNTTYTISMDNTYDFMQVATSTTLPSSGTAVNQKTTMDCRGTNTLKMTDGTYSANGVTVTVLGNKITLNGLCTSDSMIQIPLTDTISSGEEKLMHVFNTTTANVKFGFTESAYDAVVLSALNPKTFLKFDNAKDSIEIYFYNNENYNNYSFTAEIYDIEELNELYSNSSMSFTTNESAKYLVVQYYGFDRYIGPGPDEILNTIEIKQNTISNGITLVSDEEGVRTYNILINANDTDNFKVDYDYFFAIKIFTYEDDEDIELTPIKGTFTLSSRGD